MDELRQLVVLTLDGRRYALDLRTIDRVVRAVAVTALPGAPSTVAGVIDVQGEVIPLFDLRRRFGLPARPLRLADQMVVARTAQRRVALWVDEVADIVSCPASEVLAADTLVPGLAYVQGVVRLPDGLVLIHDLDRFLSEDEADALDAALAGT